MKRTIVQEGRKTGEGETPSGVATPITQVASTQASEQPVEEKRRIQDPERGLDESEGGTQVDVKDEKDEIKEEYAKNADSP